MNNGQERLYYSLMRPLVIFAALLLAACASGSALEPSIGVSADYQTAMLNSGYKSMHDDPNLISVPWSVKEAYVQCSTTYLMQFYTPSERAKLDAYAQGGTLTVAESNAIESAYLKRVGRYNFDSLTRTCPNDVPNFKKYLGSLKLGG